MRIDPHTHSNCSDGTESPSRLVAAAQQANLGAIAITDHDTTAGWQEAAAAAEQRGIALVRGCEFSCASLGRTVHLLGYLFDPGDADLLELMRATRASRTQRLRLITERIARDYPISYEDVLAQVPAGASPGRPHIGDALVSAGVVPDRSSAFREILHPGGPYYVKLWSADVFDVLAAIRRAGGVAVYAHPRALGRQKQVPATTIVALARAGLFGLEAHHRDHSEEMVCATKQIAKYANLAVFGSSDYHGSGKPNRLGENLTEVAVMRQLVKAGKLPVVGAKI